MKLECLIVFPPATTLFSARRVQNIYFHKVSHCGKVTSVCLIDVTNLCHFSVLQTNFGNLVVLRMCNV